MPASSKTERGWGKDVWRNKGGYRRNLQMPINPIRDYTRKRNILRSCQFDFKPNQFFSSTNPYISKSLQDNANADIIVILSNLLSALKTERALS